MFETLDLPIVRNVARTSARLRLVRGAENEHILLTTRLPRCHDQSDHQVPRRAAQSHATLHDHGLNSLTLVTVDPTSYPKPYRRTELDVKLRKMPRVVRGMILRKQTTGSSWEDFTSKSQQTTRGVGAFMLAHMT